MKRYCLALDLVDDPAFIAEYEDWHKTEKFWPEIKQSIEDSGIAQMEIYRTGNRLFMIIETEGIFSFEKKSAMDAVNPKALEWEALMWKYQLSLPWAKPGQKWVLMEEIFKIVK